MTRDMNEKLQAIAEKEDMGFDELKLLWYMVYNEKQFKLAIKEIKEDNIEVCDYISKMMAL